MMTVAHHYAQGLRAEQPKVSVAMITYNHEAFIADAIDSILMQEVDFPIELVIGEDCSPDGTQNIILDYMRKYPGLIRLSDYQENQGSSRNFQKTIARCRGEYIALLDGDDYWTSPHKLKMQIELLDTHPRFSMCCHAFRRERNGAIAEAMVQPTGRKPVYRLGDLCQWVNIMPLSMVYRRSALPAFPSWFSDANFGDWAMQLLLAEKGDIAYLPEVMGSHRIHGTNFWCGNTPSRPKIILMQIDDVKLFAHHLGKTRGVGFERSLRRRYYELIHAYLDEGDPEKARHVFHKVRAMYGYDPRVDIVEPLLVLLHMRAPGTYRWVRPHAFHLNRLTQPWQRIVRPVLRRMAALRPAIRRM